MAAEPLEIRMAKLEGASEQINERLADLRADVQAVRAEIVGVRGEVGGLRAQVQNEFAEVRGEIGGWRGEVRGELAQVRGEIAQVRKQSQGQFNWLLTLILGSILIPLIRDLVR